MTATLKLREPTYIGVKVQADIVISEYSRPETVQAKVRDALRFFISPLALGASAQGTATVDPAEADGRQSNDWQGWAFGRNLYVSELYSLIAAVPGVTSVGMTTDLPMGDRSVLNLMLTLACRAHRGIGGVTRRGTSRAYFP